MNDVLRLEDSAAQEVDYAGGKGAHLAMLIAKGFPVPPGFVITPNVYRLFVDGAGEQAKGLASFDVRDRATLRRESLRIRNCLKTRPLPDSLPAELRVFLNDYSPDQAFAVRSSSTMEDLGHAAFAGQHDTFLNCVGAEEILSCIKSCFFSLWSERAIAYRAEHGFDHDAASMAVVVQTMVQCDVAGVAFGLDPVSGDLNRMVVNATRGLGEAVVSGTAEVDHYNVEKSSGTIKSSRIARRCNSSTLPPHDSADTTETESAGAAEDPCMDACRLGRLADLLRQVEESFQFPQDIEWGFENDNLYLLQSRPITTIPPRWTRDESAERYPNPITPLTWDFVDEGFHRSLEHSFRLLGFPPFSGKWFVSHDHYIYGNQNAIAFYCRHVPLENVPLDGVRAELPRLCSQYAWVPQLPVTWMQDLDAYLAKVNAYRLQDLHSLDVRQVWDYVINVKNLGCEYFLPNIAISITQSGLRRVLAGLLRSAVGESDAPGLLDALTGHCLTKTSEINAELFELARLIREEPALERALSVKSSHEVLMQRDLEQFPEIATRFDTFLRAHEHREVDFDAYQPTWGEVPWVVLDNIRLILSTPMTCTPADKARSAELRQVEAEQTLLDRVPSDLRAFFIEVIRLVRLYTVLDDVEHYHTTRLTVPLRKGLGELGLRLKHKGILDQPMDIFFTHYADLDAAIREDSAEQWKLLAKAVRKEKRDYAVHGQHAPQWVLGTQGPDDLADAALIGTPGSPGQAEGTVFKLLGPDDFARFPQGAVLVARTTSPSWTPLFYAAAGVITESGGALSHGAIVAREMRIPAVMSVHNALNILNDGQRVRVDGTNGCIHLL